MQDVWVAYLMAVNQYWGLVQLVEHQILTLKVKGSNPLPPTNLIYIGV